jgi:hypothetical protein
MLFPTDYPTNFINPKNPVQAIPKNRVQTKQKVICRTLYYFFCCRPVMQHLPIVRKDGIFRKTGVLPKH